ncbi:MAG: hypothetical protein ACR2MN_09150 [Acidimicrobiales bacterium]
MRSSTAGRVIILLFVFIVIAAFVLVQVGGSGGLTPSPPPTSAATTSATTTPPPAAAPSGGPVTVTVTGTTPASSVDLVVGGQRTHRVDVPLPYTVQLPSVGAQGLMVSAQSSGDASASVGCSIDDGSGNPPANDSATGAAATVSCSLR